MKRSKKMEVFSDNEKKQTIQEFWERKSQADHKKKKDVHQVKRSENSVEVS